MTMFPYNQMSVNSQLFSRGVAHPSKYCTSLPFFDHPIHLGSDEFESDRFNTLITRGDSFPGGFATLQTRKSPFDDCVASMSDFCFDEDACQAKEIIGDGPREVVRV
jgi:hypothetical protein